MLLNKGEWFGLRQMCYPPICGVSLLLHNTITLLQTFTTVHRLPTDYQNRERCTNFPQKSSTWKITNQVVPAPMLLNSAFWISSSHFFQLCICPPGTQVPCQIEVSKHLTQQLLGHYDQKRNTMDEPQNEGQRQVNLSFSGSVNHCHWMGHPHFGFAFNGGSPCFWCAIKHLSTLWVTISFCDWDLLQVCLNEL